MPSFPNLVFGPTEPRIWLGALIALVIGCSSEIHEQIDDLPNNCGETTTLPLTSEDLANLAELDSSIVGRWSGLLRWVLPPPDRFEITGITAGETPFEIGIETIGSPSLVKNECFAFYERDIQADLYSADGVLRGATEMTMMAPSGQAVVFGQQFLDVKNYEGPIEIALPPGDYMQTSTHIVYALKLLNGELDFSVATQSEIVTKTARGLRGFEFGLTNSLRRRAAAPSLEHRGAGLTTR